ncbi:MAG: hypothetical protein MJ181_01850 [Treponema sp.]|nr:hypothetical protein [Treponema sp.]
MTSKENNILSLIFLILAFICFLIASRSENSILKIAGIISGIIFIIVSIVFEKLAKNPKDSNFRILKSIIVKSKKDKQK